MIRIRARSLACGGWKKALLAPAVRRLRASETDAESATDDRASAALAGGSDKPSKAASSASSSLSGTDSAWLLGGSSERASQPTSATFDAGSFALDVCLDLGAVSEVQVWRLASRLAAQTRLMTVASAKPSVATGGVLEAASAESCASTDSSDSIASSPEVATTPMSSAAGSRCAEVGTASPDAPALTADDHGAQSQIARGAMQYLVWREYCRHRLHHNPHEVALPARKSLWALPWAGQLIAPRAAAPAPASTAGQWRSLSLWSKSSTTSSSSSGAEAVKKGVAEVAWVTRARAGTEAAGELSIIAPQTIWWDAATRDGPARHVHQMSTISMLLAARGPVSPDVVPRDDRESPSASSAASTAASSTVPLGSALASGGASFCSRSRSAAEQLGEAAAALPARAAFLAAGKTGYPTVDAAVRCAASTGALSMPLRRLVLVHGCQYMHLPWQLVSGWLGSLLTGGGACHAEHTLSCQWWLGFIVDPETPAPHPHAMAHPYATSNAIGRDPTGMFVAAWCPELAAVHPAWRHSPFSEGALLLGSSEHVACEPHPGAWVPSLPASAPPTATQRSASVAQLLAEPRPGAAWAACVEVRAARLAVLEHVGAAFRDGHEAETAATDAALAAQLGGSGVAAMAVDAAAALAAAHSLPSSAAALRTIASTAAPPQPARCRETAESAREATGFVPVWEGLTPSRRERLASPGSTLDALAREVVAARGTGGHAAEAVTRDCAGRVWAEPVEHFPALRQDVSQDEEGSGWRLREAGCGLALWGMSADEVDGAIMPLLVEEDVALLLQLTEVNDDVAAAGGWTRVVEDPGRELKAWMRPASENHAIKKGAATFVARGLASRDIGEAISNMELYALWDNSWGEVYPMRRLNEFNEAMYLALDPPPVALVQPRDFPMTRHVFRDEVRGIYAVLFRSLQHRLAPQRKGYTRGVTLGVIGFVVQAVGDPADEVSRVTFVTATDVRGSIPAFLVNWIAKFLPGRWRDRCLEAVEHAFH